jgi:hypothetical protein
MANHEEDQGIRVLNEIYDQQPRSISLKLVQDFYTLQRQYQYEDDREVPMAQIRSLVSVAIEKDLVDGSDENEAAK